MNSLHVKNNFFDYNFFVYFLLLSFSGYSQKNTFKDTYPEKNSDSLVHWLKVNPKLDEYRLTNLIKIERKYSWEWSINRYKYLNEIQKIAKNLKSLHGIAYYKFHKAEFLNDESQNIRSVKLFTEALHIVERLNDISGQISILSYLSLMYLNYGTSETNDLAKDYIFKAKNLVNESNDPHAKILFLMVYLKYVNSSSESSNILKLSVISQILQLYKVNPSLEYTHIWVKFIESDFNYRIKNYTKSNTINKELIKKIKENDYHLLARINLNLAKNYSALAQYDSALISNQLALTFFNKTPKIAYCQQTGETTYGVLIAIFNNRKSIAIKLNNSKMSGALADSIIYYQRLELENNKKTIHEIQNRYNFDWSELELKDLATEKKLSHLLQNALQHKLQIEKEKFEALMFKNELEQAEKKIKQIKQNTEKQIAFAKSKIIENKSQRLYTYILMISILLLLMIIILLILRTHYRREKQITMFRDKFYTILTHDLRGSISSLTDIGSVLSYLIRNKKIAEMERVANQIDYLGVNTALLLDNMLDWGTSKSYGVDTTPKSLDISLFVTELVGRYLAALKTKNIEIVLNVPTKLITFTSPKCVDVIIRNLIANAMSYTSSGGKININMKEKGESNQILIEINDTGEGIVREKLEFIKKVFSGKIKPEVGDSGLGLGILLISYFAKKNNIDLQVTSQIGIGSCFTLIFDKTN